MHSGSRVALLALCLTLVLAGTSQSQSISQPPASLPVQSYSDDPLITGSSASAALCSLHAVLGTESAAHGIGPLTVQPDCMSMTFQHHSSATVNGQTLPSSGIATIFGSSSSSSSSGVSISSAQPTTAPVPRTSTSASSSTQSSSTAAPRQSNAGSTLNKPPAAAGWIARQNIAILLLISLALLAGFTFFLDELLAILV